MEYYTTEEKVIFIQWYYSGNSIRNIKDLFSGLHPDRRIPSLRTLERIIDHFKNTGSVNKLCSCRKVAPGREMNNELDVLIQVVENKNVSLREMGKHLGISHTAASKILKKQTPSYKSFKYKTQHEIFEDDKFLRMMFCEKMMDMVNNDRDFLPQVLFSDECTFSTHGTPNPQNFRYWSTENLHLTVNNRSQYRKTVNVWIGILGYRLIGPFFIDGTLTAVRYLQLLQEEVGPALENHNIDNHIWFQHDGCPAHNSLMVREFLNSTFQNHWIGRGGTIHWPARSPDIAPNDFFLWGYLKNNLYNNEATFQSVNDLKEAIVENCQNVSHYMLANVRREFYDRLGYCLAVNGGLFEHIVNR
jgi:hypothetical protein